MKTISVKVTQGTLDKSTQECAAINPQIAVAFGAPSHFRDGGFIKQLKSRLPRTQIIGCSTAGEIGNDGVTDEGLSLIAMHFDKTQIKVASIPLKSPDQSFSAGAKIGAELMSPNLTSIFVLMPGLNVNGSEFARGISSKVPANVVVTGGLAGDGVSFLSTHTLLNENVYGDHVVAFGLYGDSVKVSAGSRGGWKPFGPARRVTRAEANILYELDGKPALQLYKEYLGDKADGLPASGLLYPFAILDEEERKETGLIRTILDVDHKKGCLILAGDIPQNSIVCLMHADTDALVKGAEAAAVAALGKGCTGSSATLLVSCVGRKIIMGSDVDEEIEAVVRAIGKESSYAGFYSYGEICPFSKNGFSELHNQTMTITHISEEP